METFKNIITNYLMYISLIEIDGFSVLKDEKHKGLLNALLLFLYIISLLIVLHTIVIEAYIYTGFTLIAAPIFFYIRKPYIADKKKVREFWENMKIEQTKDIINFKRTQEILSDMGYVLATVPDEVYKQLEDYKIKNESLERIIDGKSNISDVSNILMRIFSKKEILGIEEKTQLSFIVAGILSVYKEKNWDFEELKLTSELELDIKRINQIEIIIDHYSERIKKVKEDKNLDETERENKLKYWLRLRDRDIDRIEE